MTSGSNLFLARWETVGLEACPEDIKIRALETTSLSTVFYLMANLKLLGPSPREGGSVGWLKNEKEKKAERLTASKP